MEEYKKTLVVHFSYTTGNTKRIAEKISKVLNADMDVLEPELPYSKDYDKVVEQGEEEVQTGYRPKLRPLHHLLRNYDRIIVGSPTRWYSPAPVVMSFLEGIDLHGKTIVPFMTHAGWPGHVLADMKDAARRNGANVKEGHAFQFSAQTDHRAEMKTSGVELEQWISSLM